MTRKPAPRTQANGGALLIATLTILIALVTFVPLTGVGQPSGQSTDPGTRLRAKGSVSGSSQPSSPVFLPAVIYPAGHAPFSVAVADVNGDGKPDLVATNSFTCDSGGCSDAGAVVVLLGNGNGTFRHAVTYSSGGDAPISVAVADVNGDGKPDLVVANESCASNSCGTGTVGILLGNGDGTFQAAVSYGSGGYNAYSVAVADVNRDGRPDLLVLNFGSCLTTCTNGSVGVLLGNGDGSFQPAVPYDSSAEGSTSVAVADVNGDGKPDLVVASNCNCPTGTVSILLGNGDGSFQAARTYGSGGTVAYSVAVADVNKDGKPDLLVANYCGLTGSCTSTSSGAVGVLLGNGDGTFQAAISYGSGGYGADSIAVADVNGDGNPDLVVANTCGASGSCTTHSTLGVLLGNGDGTFQTALSYSSRGLGHGAVAVKDVNGDGKPDLIVAHFYSASVAVLLNNTPLGKSATSTSLTSSLNPSTYGQKVTWTATVTTTGSIAPTGHVSFTWGGIHIIGSGTLNSSGVATLTKSNLNADAYPLTAVYKGDTNNLGSTSAILNQVVQETTSAATLTSSPNPSTQGQAVTFTAKVTSPTVVPTGPVTFTSGKTVLGTAQLSGGKASFTTSSLPTGSDVVTVTYNGDSNIAKSTASVTQVVQP